MSEPVDTIGVGALTADKLAAANINPTTGLATDYLNHFNEVVMLLELLPAMPDCVADVLKWTPRSYQDHFRSSRFAEKDLAIRAYEAAPQAIRATFDTLVAEIEREVTKTQERLADLGGEASQRIGEIALGASERLLPLLASAGGVIHGHDIDPRIEPDSATESSQADIDALFA